MAYTDQHRMLLQAFMQEGSIGEYDAQELVIKLFKSNQVAPIISRINLELQPINLQIKRAQCELTHDTSWVLRSPVPDDINQWQDEFSEAQLSLLVQIFQEIINSNDGRVRSITCLNMDLPNGIKFATTGRDEFLKNMVKKKWLTFQDGYYYMGARSIAQLIPFFRTITEEALNKCHMCRDVMFYGTVCLECNAVIHNYCLKKIMQDGQDTQCPNCEKVLPGALDV